MRARQQGWIIGGALVAALAVIGALTLTSREQSYDPKFDTRVATPAYQADRPLVLYDEGHLNTHTMDAAYKSFADLLRHDGYDVRSAAAPFAQEQLARVSVLVVVLPRGTNDANDAPAFTSQEVDAVDHYVRGGGALLLVTDHWPFGAAAESLALRFGVHMGKGLTEDVAHCDATLGSSHLVFARANGLLRDHPIVRGRSSSESVRRVLTFTGQSLLGPPGATPFMSLSDDATERPPTAPRVERKGGDLRVSMDYGEPAPAKGRAQGLALEVGKGRIVVLGEAGMLRAQREKNGMLVGMNHPGYDNRQLALNIMHWLSRAL